ncbi:DUF3568 family protein [Thermodesulfobacteriota bacterium]
MIKVRYLLLVLLCFFLSSCAPVVFLAGTAAGVGGYKYYEGALKVVYQAPYIKTWDASLKSLEEMGFKIGNSKRDLTSGKIEAKRADDKSVTVSLKYLSSQETEVSIRVGLFGDENASNVIKDKIGNVLYKK